MNGSSRKYSTYILQSLVDHKHYTGLSSDVEKRLKMHNAGKVQSTKKRKPFILIYQEVAETLLEARKREKYFKSAAGRHFLKSLKY
ncbi:MAG: GIY-YIG nuclease family protein [Ignavibacteriales bacterium]|nr:GIY-YIG nuclease family protein [Ignavibacteriales bacterium]